MPDVDRPGERDPSLGVVARRVGRSWLARLSGRRRPGRSPDLAGDELCRRLEGLAAATPDAVREVRSFELPANRPPWLDTGLDLEAGERVSWFAVGRVHLSKLLDLFVGPDFQLWGRVGQGEVFRGTRASHSFTVETSGRLHLASYFPAEWKDRRGAIDVPPERYAALAGGMTVVVVRWNAAPEETLATWATRDDPGGLVSGELERLRARPQAPAGWRYLWFIGPGEIFTAGEADGRPCMHCHTEADTGILQRDVAFPLTPGTRLRWEWKVDALPSTIREDSLPTHDYLSIAVEFENGTDLTYTWSPELPEGHAYWCPLPTWKDRELHVVQRSGTDGLGTWCAEERDLHADALACFGAEPGDVVRVWFIAVSLFQRGEGRCTWRGVELAGPGGSARIV
jgi:hypothetical protein